MPQITQPPFPQVTAASAAAVLGRIGRGPADGRGGVPVGIGDLPGVPDGDPGGAGAGGDLAAADGGELLPALDAALAVAGGHTGCIRARIRSPERLAAAGAPPHRYVRLTQSYRDYV